MKILLTVGQFIGATLFWIGWVVSTVVFTISLLFLFPFKPISRYRFLQNYPGIVLKWLEWTCGVRSEVSGAENIKPGQSYIFLANHQSTWETFFFAANLPPISWVLKRELMRIPGFGWGLSMVHPIAIDRSQGSTAMEQVIAIGRRRLADGWAVLLFPEGTRIPVNETKSFKIGGALLASEVGYPVIPIAHNAGMSWPRMSYLKRPGVISVAIGEAIETKGRAPEDILKEVEEWINNKKSGLEFKPLFKGV